MASPLPPYPTEVTLVDRRCHGKINICRRNYGYTQTERFHEEPIGQPPFTEVIIERFYNSYDYDTTRLIGFISPTIEFLGKEKTLSLLDELDELLSTQEAAERLHRSPRYLEKLRRQGEGPKFWRIADGVFFYTVWYESRDIDIYAEELKTRPEKRGGRRNRPSQKV